MVGAGMDERLLPEGSQERVHRHVQGFGEIVYGVNLLDTLSKMESRKSIRE